MKKRKIGLLMVAVLALTVCLCGCSKTENASPEATASIGSWEPIPEEIETPAPEEEPVEEEEVEEVVEGCYRSELTNEWIDEALANQRPIAVMVDNERTALNHFGVNSCDIVYEIMNSTANDRITRLMCVVKDYTAIEQLGSIRSTRPTNFMLAGEYDAILVHDGGPYYNDAYYGKDYVDNLSGGFARFINGKSTEFTEYVTPDSYTNTKGKTFDGIVKRIEDAKYSVEYTEHYSGNHFTFSNNDYKLSEDENNTEVKEVLSVDLSGAFHHNSSKLVYNEETMTYDYYEYGNPHVDELDGNVTSFKNLIVYSVDFNRLDENGYLVYNVIGSGNDGWFVTNGEAVPITWAKETENGITIYKNSLTGEDIVLNTGKTYISLIPSDSWSGIKVGEDETSDAEGLGDGTSDSSTEATASGDEATASSEETVG